MVRKTVHFSADINGSIENSYSCGRAQNQQNESVQRHGMSLQRACAKKQDGLMRVFQGTTWLIKMSGFIRRGQNQLVFSACRPIIDMGGGSRVVASTAAFHA